MKPITVTELDHIVLNVKDIDRSLDFYANVLSLKIERLEEFRAGKIGFPSVRINNDTIIDLFPAKEAVNRPGNLNHFCLVVGKDDFAGIVDYLNDHRVAILNGPISRWGARGRATSVYFHDPDQNEIEIRCY
ncbi:MAG TPA: VOC family protein [Candidatus Binatia bacterium]|jgi:catechol 2,3-dioxygenase-like lactoylglutathione lyase family enzyme|nr:VOC family protein [Candidatus Binatia bacterium]